MATKTITRYRNRPKARHHSRAKTTIPLAAVAGFIPLAVFAYEGFQAGGIANAGQRVAQRLTGIDSTAHVFIPAELARGWTPILAGFLAHKAADMLGINRMLGRMRVPLVRI
jgi:hypothetical protein